MEPNAAARALDNLNLNNSRGGGGRSHGSMQRNASGGELRRLHQTTTRNGPSPNSNFDNMVADQSGGGILDNSYGNNSAAASSVRQSSRNITNSRGIKTSFTTKQMQNQPPPPDRRYNRRIDPTYGVDSHSVISGLSMGTANFAKANAKMKESYQNSSNTNTNAKGCGAAPRRFSIGVQQQQQQQTRRTPMTYNNRSASMPVSSGDIKQKINDKRRQTVASNNSNNSNNSQQSSSYYNGLDGSNRSGYSDSGNNNNHVVTNNGYEEPSQQQQQQQRTAYNVATTNPSWFNNNNNGGYTNNNYDPNDDDDDCTMVTKAQALNPKAMAKAKHMTYPQGEVTIIYTDVQGSTSFWETCPSDMKTATDIHDKIMRQCYTDHQGYEITTEGDAFNLAFQHPADALAFALQAQLKLYKADWPMGILNHPDGKDEPALKYRGFRVRFGIHHGHTTSRVHENTGRTVYAGDGVKIAKSIEGMCHGGQILTSMETWKAVSGMAERYLGRPQVLDCGEHLLFETKDQASGSSGVTTTRYTRRIMQLVPSDLAFDFFEARGRRDVPSEDGTMGYEIKDANNVSGRLFPPLISKRQLTTCFLNAPYANGKVTICFVYTVGLGDTDNKARNLAVLAKCVRKQLLALSPPGYECQEDDGCWMLAFDRMAHAVTFGLNLKAAVMQGSANDLVGSVDRENMFKVGVLSGPFTSMGPHKTTGMADYFGPIVNRAARVASNCEPGQICVGIPLSNGVSADPPDFGPTINVRLQGIKKLKGITIDVAIFSCNKKRIETPYK